MTASSCSILLVSVRYKLQQSSLIDSTTHSANNCVNTTASTRQ